MQDQVFEFPEQRYIAKMNALVSRPFQGKDLPIVQYFYDWLKAGLGDTIEANDNLVVQVKLR